MSKAGGVYEGKELKYKDYEFAHVGSLNAVALVLAPEQPPFPLLTQLTGVAQGTGRTERIGKTYKIHSFHVHSHFKFIAGTSTEPGTSPLMSAVARIMVVLDHQPNGTRMTPYEVISWPPLLGSAVLQMRNLEYEDRFTVLHDTRVSFNRKMGVTTDDDVREEQKRLLSIDIDFKPPLVVTCSGPSADLPDCVSNSIQIIGMADHYVSDQVKFHFLTRIRFTD